MNTQFLRDVIRELEEYKMELQDAHRKLDGMTEYKRVKREREFLALHIRELEDLIAAGNAMIARSSE